MEFCPHGCASLPAEKTESCKGGEVCWGAPPPRPPLRSRPGSEVRKKGVLRGVLGSFRGPPLSVSWFRARGLAAGSHRVALR